MEINNVTVKLVKLTASEGMVLTDGKARCKTVYLGVNDSPDNWSEITEEEYNAIKEERKAEGEQN